MMAAAAYYCLLLRLVVACYQYYDTSYRHRLVTYCQRRFLLLSSTVIAHYHRLFLFDVATC